MIYTTPEKMEILSKYEGIITIEGSTEKPDIVVRIPLYKKEADKVLPQIMERANHQESPSPRPEGLINRLCRECGSPEWRFWKILRTWYL